MWTTERGASLQVTIERAGLGGDGVGHAPDGRVVFVRGAVPGDTVTLQVQEVKARHLRGRVTAIDTPSADRVTPFCGLTAACGGCPWQAWAPAAQRAGLQAHVQYLVQRAVGPEGPAVEPTIAVAPTRGWRSTTRVHWADGRLGFRPPSARGVLDVPMCPVLAPMVDTLYQAVRARLLPRLTGAGTLRITADATGGTLALSPEQLGRGLIDEVERFVRQVPECRGAIIRPPHGRPLTIGRAVNALGPARTDHPADGFVQAHQPGAARLVADVVERLRGITGRVLELYAGSGSFTFALAEAGISVTAVEKQGSAARALADVARSRGLARRVEAVRGDAAALPPGAFAAALIDPPRAGAKEALAGLHATSIQRLIYVSCDPATFARDAGWLVRQGWRVVGVTPYDLFPHTGHVELVAEFRRDD